MSKAWYCQNDGRMEDDEGKDCSQCGEKRQRVSRFEWFLADALHEYLHSQGADFKITEQWPLGDHRGFNWYFDLCVRVGSFHQLIEVDGADHQQQASYKGPGGGYTRDYDKEWELFSVQKYHKFGYGLMRLKNEECRLKVAGQTARRVADQIIARAKTI